MAEASFNPVTSIVVAIIIYVIGVIFSHSWTIFEHSYPGISGSRQFGIALKWIGAILFIIAVLWLLYEKIGHRRP